MRFLILIVALFFTTYNGNASDRKYPVDQINKLVYMTNNSIIRRNETIINVEKSKAYYSRRKAITLKNSTHFDQFKYIVVPYSPNNTFKSLSAQIYDKNGKEIKKFKNKEIEDISAFDGFSLYNDNRYKVIEIEEGYTYPFTIEYEYTTVLDTYLLPTKWYLSENIDSYTERSKLKITSTEENSFKVHAALKEYKLEKKLEEPTNILFEAKNIAPMTIEDNGLSKQEQMPYMITTIQNFQIEKHKGSFESWASLGDFYYNLNNNRQELDDKTIQALKEKIPPSLDTHEKIKRIYEHLQEKTRYVSVQLGIGGWQTFPAEYVEKNSYGDCKALTNYTKSVFDIFEIEAYPVLVNAGSENNKEKFDEKKVYNRFNHVILSVPTKKDTIWLECTSQSSPFNHLGKFTMNRKGLLIKPNGQSHLVSTQRTSLQNDYEKLNLEISLKQNATAAIDATVKAAGILSDKYISTENLPKEKFDEVIPKLLHFSNAKLESHEELKKKGKEVEFKGLFEINNSMNKTGNKFFLKPMSFIQKEQKIMSKKRKSIVIIPFSQQKEYIINYIIPENYKIENIDASPLSLSNEFGSFTGEIIKKENGLSIRIIKTIKAGRFEASKAEEINQFSQEINRFLKRIAVLEKN